MTDLVIIKPHSGNSKTVKLQRRAWRMGITKRRRIVLRFMRECVMLMEQIEAIEAQIKGSGGR